MQNMIRHYAGHRFTPSDMSLIMETIAMYPNLSRNELASTICELTGWVTPNGKPKVVQCIGFLRQLEEECRINLPDVRTGAASGKNSDISCTNKLSTLYNVDMSEVRECGEVRLEIARPGNYSKKWRSYVSNFHKLGDPRVHGAQLRYMITSEGRDLGCLLFSASSWALAHREEWIGWTAEEKSDRLHLIVNNSRFLILPWVRVKNLASRALSIAARRIQNDWLKEYCYAPVLLETFVDAAYSGTSYKASNWIYLGETKGRGRNDRHREAVLTQKSIYVLPLQRNFREILKGDKLYKAISLDDEW